MRKQLDSVDRAIEAEAIKATPDGQRLNWLAQAQERLAEQERILDNRPLPGSRRPAQERQDRRAIIQLEPVGIAGQVQDTHEAQPAAPARPAGWEYDDPASVSVAPLPG